MDDTDTIREQILDTALDIASHSSWEALRLHQITAEMGIGLNEIRYFFAEKEDLVDAWFDRADARMLDEADNPEIVEFPTKMRLHHLMMVWLKSFHPYRQVTRQMVLGKLEPGHIHFQIKGIMRVSRTVQWLREAAHRRATLPLRAFEETGLTTIYLVTFLYWMYDRSKGAEDTSNFLLARLTSAQSIVNWLSKLSLFSKT